jgi:hypothetical protein
MMKHSCRELGSFTETILSFVISRLTYSTSSSVAGDISSSRAPYRTQVRLPAFILAQVCSLSILACTCPPFSNLDFGTNLKAVKAINDHIGKPTFYPSPFHVIYLTAYCHHFLLIALLLETQGHRLPLLMLVCIDPNAKYDQMSHICSIKKSGGLVPSATMHTAHAVQCLPYQHASTFNDEPSSPYRCARAAVFASPARTASSCPSRPCCP